ncbi:hypothetical protein BAU15_07950 [Enterococcus sp. JM4C]|uniref:DUF7006 family protein n=1 Tax=Candidatus Enterococcus huntleyi TaxID=1857217 RepID=UPI00137A665D|nr:hypothetical protein [Enterococcus sp. JM4C]KAF1297828.1 hypothetical protein BAU15_07950 [Enterococcus sp. JM4C]
MEINHSDYIHHFEAIYKEEHFQQKYPKIAGRMQEICTSIETIIQEISEQNALWSIGKLQGYDAQLQIILDLKGILAEEKVMEIAESGYKTFAKEQFGYKLNEKAPVSLFQMARYV